MILCLMSDDPFKQIFVAFNKSWNAPIRQRANVRSRPSFWSLKSWRAQDQDDLVALATEVRENYRNSHFTDNDFINETAYEITIAVEERAGRKFPMPLLEAVFDVTFQIINVEYFMEISAQADGWAQNLDLKGAHELTQWLKRHQHFIKNHEELFAQVREKLIILLGGLVGHIGQLPDAAAGHASLSFDAPIMTLMDDPVVGPEPGRAVVLQAMSGGAGPL